MVRKYDIRQVDSIAKRLGLKRAQRRLLHDAMDRECLADPAYREILERAQEIKREHPGRREG